jgi:DNA invertase Pin-like site-specific DNA recombinase
MPQKSPSKSEKIKPVSPNFKTIGYLRVSTGDQELEKNKSDILHLANHLNLGKVIFVEEIVSGKVSWKKRKIAEIIAEFQTGDTLIVSELSRLGRSMLECMEILSVAVEKGVRVYAVKGNWSLDSSIQSKIVAMAFSMASEIERDLISQRTKEALRYKKEQGIKLGSRQIKTRPIPPGNRSLDAKRLDAKVYRRALRHNRSQSAQLAEKKQPQAKYGQNPMKHFLPLEAFNHSKNILF